MGCCYEIDDQELRFTLTGRYSFDECLTTFIAGIDDVRDHGRRDLVIDVWASEEPRSEDEIWKIVGLFTVDRSCFSDRLVLLCHPERINAYGLRRQLGDVASFESLGFQVVCDPASVTAAG